MAKTAMKIKQQRKQKFSTREYSRCRICGNVQTTHGHAHGSLQDAMAKKDRSNPLTM